jgi:membrane protein required for colicin V production
MIIDLIAAGLFILAIFKGIRNGFVLAVFSFIAFFIGLAAALKLSSLVAGYLGNSTNISQRWLPVLAFTIVFIGVIILVRLGAKALEGVLRAVMLGWLNKLAGVLLYSLVYLFIFSVLVFYAEKLSLLKPRTTEASVTYSFIQPLGPKFMDALGYVLPFFKNMFGQLESFFDGIAKKKSD